MVYVSLALFLLSSAVMLISFFGLVSPGSETHPNFSGIHVLFYVESLFPPLFSFPFCCCDRAIIKALLGGEVYLVYRLLSVTKGKQGRNLGQNQWRNGVS